MTEQRRLCRVLLNGTGVPTDLARAEALLVAELERVGGLEAGVSFRQAWRTASADEPLDELQKRQWLLGLAPFSLLNGAWLARVAQPLNGHLESQCHLMRLYGHFMGMDNAAHSFSETFRVGLTQAGISLASLANPDFFYLKEIQEYSLPPALTGLSLMHRPRRFFPELLGFTLAHVYLEPAWWCGPVAEMDEPKRLAEAAFNAYPLKNEHRARITAGWILYLDGYQALCRNITASLELPKSKLDLMVEIVESRQQAAVGYHRGIRLKGRSLDERLADGPAGTLSLLEALRGSPFVDSACPAGSRFIKAMEFGGPMFGVFDPVERQAALDWIENPEAPSLTSGLNGQKLLPQADLPAAPSDAKALRYTTRELFTVLLQCESPIDCPPAAHEFIKAMLRRTRFFRLIKRKKTAGFAYTPDKFLEFTENLHHTEVSRYQALKTAPAVSLEFCRWAILQLAPAILTDGAWLAGIATADETLGDIGRQLEKIYMDELGNGEVLQNHPNVYRRLLDSQQISLPEIDSVEFAQHPAFMNSAFDIPVYLLAMGLATEAFFPELLGLNLAIELSGLGAGYMRVAEMLRFYGLDPTIIELHLSIDNLASGHAGRAREAVTLYLDGVRRQGPEAVEAQWQRIRLGYDSLDAAAAGLALGFFRRYAFERLGERLRFWGR